MWAYAARPDGPGGTARQGRAARLPRVHRVRTDADDAFVRETEPFRREMLAHCYRMLGSVDDAEDVVQETYLRAWRSYGAFEGRSSVRTWLYRIATNACLTALERPGRRVLPSGLGGPEPDPRAAPEPGPGVRWLQPIPDALVVPVDGDPAAVVAAREGLRLALIAALQYLPGTQRAVLILRDVLSFPATEVAGILDLSVTAVKSSLQRARGRLRELSLAADDIAEPASPGARAVLDQYMAAFQDADTAALQRLLRDDTQMEATPIRNWYAGSKTCVPFLSNWILGAPGDWRMLPTSANGQPAAVGYRLGPDGGRHAYGVVVLGVTGTRISRIVSFGEPALAARFGFPATLPADYPS